MDLTIDLSGRGDRATRLYTALRAAILDGRVPEGERLPPTRQLARAELGISRTTVTVAYELLAAEGFVAGRVGAGTVVICDRPAGSGRRRGRGRVRPRAGWSVPGLGWPCWSPVVLRWRTGPRPASTSAVGSPDAALFPVARGDGRSCGRWTRRRPVTPGYADPAGHPRLRAAIARHVGRLARGARHARDRCSSPPAPKERSSLLGAVLVEPGATSPSRSPGIRLRATCSRRSARGSCRCPWMATGSVVDALPADARLVVSRHRTSSRRA